MFKRFLKRIGAVLCGAALVFGGSAALGGCGASTAVPKAEDLQLLTPGTLTVGYHLGRTPFAYNAGDGIHLAGYDIELAPLLAEALDLEAELVRINPETEWADLGVKYDVALSGLVPDPFDRTQALFSEPYAAGGQAAGVALDNESLLLAVNAAIEKLDKSGDLRTLNQKFEVEAPAAD